MKAKSHPSLFSAIVTDKIMKVSTMATLVKNDGGNFQESCQSQNSCSVRPNEADKMRRKVRRTRSSGFWIFRIKDIKDQGYLCIPAAACLAKMSVHLSASNLAAGWHCCVTITNPHKDDGSERFVGKWQE